MFPEMKMIVFCCKFHRSLLLGAQLKINHQCFKWWLGIKQVITLTNDDPPPYWFSDAYLRHRARGTETDVNSWWSEDVRHLLCNFISELLQRHNYHQFHLSLFHFNAGIIQGMGSINEKQWNIIMLSLIGQAHTQNDSCNGTCIVLNCFEGM